MAALVVAVTTLAAPAPAPLRLDHIELLGTEDVTVHFEAPADQTTTLQYADLPGAGGLVWLDLFVAPAFPFVNHYVIADGRSRRGRLYRLRVTP